jgi:transcriptional regulator with XRE-family HTH domain
MSTVQKLFGKKIKAIRKDREMTQERLAELSGLSLQYIGEIERGTRNPSLTSMESLSAAFDLPIAELFNLDEFKLSIEELRTILVKQIENADEERLRSFFHASQVFFR